MSAPARELAAPSPRRRPSRRPATAPSPVPRRAPVPARSGAGRAAKDRTHHVGFALFAGALVGSMVFGIVVLNVLLAQQSFRIDAAERRLEALAVEHLELVEEQATLSAPGRIAAWASRHGMRLPDDIRILRAPSGPADPSGADPASTDGQGGW